MVDRTRFQAFANKPRVLVLTDISNEPDDAESLVRYLLYSNQFQTEGLVAVSSTWMKNKVCPQDIHKIIDAYAGAVDNLNRHTHPESPYPSADSLRALVKSGPPVYGFAGVGLDKPLTDGAHLLLERIEATSEESLWVLVWGGTNVLAQVLLTISDRYSAEEAAKLRAKLRVYTISDQDDSSAWIRTQFPDIFYISSIHGWNQYGLAAWTGISGDKYYGFDQGGPDFSKVSKQWLKENIQIGPLGSAYPDFLFIPEGDTPTFLYLVQNGLGDREHPEYGSWGGRYALTDASDSGQQGKHYSDVSDSVVGIDGKTYRSNQATIWRWRDTFQNDFAARMKWSLNPGLVATNHHPVIVVNGSGSLTPLRFEAEAGSFIELNASETYDPDGDNLTFKWWQYREPSATQWLVDYEVSELGIEKLDPEGKKIKVILPGPEKSCMDLISRQPLSKGQLLHLVLEVTDSGTPALTSYRRVLIQTTNKDLKGGNLLKKGAERNAIGDAMKDYIG
ncbi:cellulose-binding protein [Colletotrichum navitas]|uniref:Cellulose-binding protein n=1 Tax=Colletotrichum navitas TaxID=681940 RepID=A0AAD8V4J0_9PEZI|nr:cellulose-binding protein [Colletotrichum navitas]KAK1590462.1 cellulose-binding protein [Colletotrichum navitas]